MRGERERLSQLKAAHAGVNAKAWDTSHASLDRELARFQKFLKSKARRVAEEEVLQVHNILCSCKSNRWRSLFSDIRSAASGFGQ